MNLEVEKISKEEMRENMKRMKNGKAVGPDDIPVEVWKCLGEIALEFLTKLYNRTMESERMPEEWRDSILIPIFKNKGDVQSCSNYRGIKLICHGMKLWERVVERRLKLTFMQYPEVHTNYIISHCTTLQYNHNYLTRYLGRKTILNKKNN